MFASLKIHCDTPKYFFLRYLEEFEQNENFEKRSNFFEKFPTNFKIKNF